MPELHLISVAQEHAEFLWKLGIDPLALESDFSAALLDWDTHQRLLMEHFQYQNRRMSQAINQIVMPAAQLLFQVGPTADLVLESLAPIYLGNGFACEMIEIGVKTVARWHGSNT